MIAGLLFGELDVVHEVFFQPLDQIVHHLLSLHRRRLLFQALLQFSLRLGAVHDILQGRNGEDGQFLGITTHPGTAHGCIVQRVVCRTSGERQV